MPGTWPGGNTPPPQRDAPGVTRTVVAVVVGVLALVTGCGSTGSGAAPSSTASSTAVTTVDTAAVSSSVAAMGIPPKPDPTTTAAYLAELRAIEPQLVDDDNPDKAVTRGRDQCRSVYEHPTDQAKLIDLANRRFTAPGHSAGFGPEVAEKVLAVVRKHLCPTY